MSRKSTLLAVAAAASLGAFALSSTDAFAFHASGSGLRVAPGAMHVGTGLHYGTYRLGPPRIVKLPPPIVKLPPPIVHPPHHWHWVWHRYWIPPVVVGGAAAATYVAATPAAVPVTDTCTCLTKQYTPEGAVVFKDVCTNEMAMNPPAATQQQGYLQPQTQAQ